MAYYEPPLPRIRPSPEPPTPRPRPASPTEAPQGEAFDIDAYSRQIGATPVDTKAPAAASTDSFDIDAYSKQIGATPVDNSTALDYGTEFGKGVVRGGAHTVGSAVTGATALLAKAGTSDAVRAYLPDLKRIPSMNPQERAKLRTRINQEQDPSVRSALHSTFSDILDGGILPEELDAAYPELDITHQPGIAIGQAISDAGPAPAPGWENGVTATLGEGLGSVAAGLGLSMVPGIGQPLAGGMFIAGGAGEAVQNAMQFDEAEKKAGRPGLTQEQIAFAAILGTGPGATDILPIEAMLATLRIPPVARRAIAQRIARIGGQAVIEGAQEGGQQVLQNAISGGYNENQSLGEGVIPNVAAGGGVGALVQALLEPFVPGKQHGGGTPPPPAPPPPAPPPTAGGSVPSVPQTVPETPPAVPPVPAVPVPPGPQTPPPVPASVPPAPSPMAPPAPPMVPETPEIDGEYRRILREAGYTDEDVDAMSPEERQAEIEQIAETGQVQANPPTPAPESTPPPAEPAPPVNGQPATTPDVSPVVEPDVSRETTPEEEASSAFDDALAALGKPAGTRAAPVKVETAADLQVASQVAATDPTDGQRGAGNFQHVHVRLPTMPGLDISLETPKGGIRRSKPDAATPWQVEMPVAYGYIRRSRAGKDGKLDVFIGDNPQSRRAFVLDQRDLGTGKFDETKIIAGVDSLEEAQRVYEDSYSDGRGADRVMSISEIPASEVGQFSQTYDPTKPYAEMPAMPETPKTPPAPAKPAKAGRPASLLDFILGMGGIKDEEGEFRHLGGIRRKFIRNAGGMSHDYMREAAAEAGYLDHIYGNRDRAMAESTTADLREMILNEANGVQKYYSSEDEAQLAGNRDEELAAGARDRAERDMLDAMAEHEIPEGAPELFEAAVKLYLDKGGDPMDAYEAAAILLIKEETPSDYADASENVIKGWSDAEQPSEVAPDGEGTRPPGFPDDIPVAEGKAPEGGGLREEGGDGGNAGAKEETRTSVITRLEAGEQVTSKNGDTVVWITDADTKKRGWVVKWRGTASATTITLGGVIHQGLWSKDYAARRAADEAGYTIEAEREAGEPEWWKGLTTAGRAPLIAKASSTLSPRTTWWNLSDDNKAKITAAYEASQKAEPTNVADRPEPAVSEGPPDDGAAVYATADEARAAVKNGTLKSKKENEGRCYPLASLKARKGKHNFIIAVVKVRGRDMPHAFAQTVDGKWTFEPQSESWFTDEALKAGMGPMGRILYKMTSEEVRTFAKNNGGYAPDPTTLDAFGFDGTKKPEAPPEGYKLNPTPEGGYTVTTPEGHTLAKQGWGLGATWKYEEALLAARKHAKDNAKAEPVTEPGADGKPQTVIPGTEVSPGAKAQVGADKPLKPKVPQKDPAGMFGDDAQQTDLVDAIKAKKPAAPDEDAPFVYPVEKIRDHFASGKGFSNILAARKFAREAGVEGTDKEVEEAIEVAIVMAARKIVERGRELEADAKDTYKQLQYLYKNQPKLGGRTGESMAEQAYSTPVPLAFIASRLAGIDSKTSVFEPTAGNGALLIEAAQNRAVVNEINAARRAALKELGFNPMQQDATEPATIRYALGVNHKGKKLEGDRSPNPFDVVIMNPPFGAVRDKGRSKEWEIDGWKTTNVDMAIALEALKAMRDDGSAVLIVGGVAGRAGAQATEEERRDGYRAQQRREFYFKLYREYNVVNHFTVDGALYEKQGAGWPVDVIVIKGKGKAARSLPTVELPKAYVSWADLEGELNAIDARPSERPAPSADSGRPGQPGSGGRSGGDSGPKGPVVRGPGGVPGPEASGERPDSQQSPGEGGVGSAGSGVEPGGRGVDRGASEQSVLTPEQEAEAAFNDALAGLTAAKPDEPTSIDPTDSEQFSAPDGEFGWVYLGYSDVADNREYSFREGRDAGGAWRQVRIFDPNAASATDVITWHVRDLSEITGESGAALTYATNWYSRGGEDNEGTTDLDEIWAEHGPAITRYINEHKRRGPKDVTPPPKALPPPPKPPRPSSGGKPKTAGGAIKTAATEAGMGLSDAIKGLDALFSSKNKLGAGPSFDEETYQKAKPFFAAATAHFMQSAKSIREAIDLFVNHLFTVEKWAVEKIAEMGEYIKRFVVDSLVKPAERTKIDQLRNQTGQTTYQPQSGGKPMGTLVPNNTKDATRHALEALEKKVGNLDAFVSTELGWTIEELYDRLGAEQVDGVASGIAQVRDGSAIVIGDQTGIGKGRQMAAMIVWAKRNGMIPVFVTKDAGLYGDMYRDLAAIGLPNPKVVITDNDKSIPLDDDALDWVAESEEAKANDEDPPPKVGRFFTSGNGAKQKRLLEEVAETKAANVDAVFTTYSQMQTQKGEEIYRRDLLRRIAPDSMLILDESHEAGGSGGQKRQKRGTPPKRSDFFREVVGTARGVIYSSATYAKRPDSMTLYSKTDLGLAIDNPKLLPELIARGGVPMQQIIASMLAQNGQYLRRERSFEGIEYAVETVPVDETVYRAFTDGLRAVYGVDILIEPELLEIADQLIDEIGGDIAGDNATGDMGASSTQFSSIMHNLIGQMTLAIKAKEVARLTIEAVARGEKPVVVVSHTMESFVDDYMEGRDLKVGDDILITFADVLKRYLERTRRVTIKVPEGSEQEAAAALRALGYPTSVAGKKKLHVTIPLEKFSDTVKAAYHAAEKIIDDADFKALPVSPIDYLRNALAKAGLSTAEITGRKLMIDYSTSPPTIVHRPKNEQGQANKRVVIRKFQKGDLQTTVINKTGSTGISMHAEPKSDRLQRHMIIAQADPDIAVHLQTLGRIHRTGQVVLPRFTQVVADIPAEARPTSVLLKKMASLNANTTGARKSVFSGEAVDFMNEYGDQVAASVLAENPEWNARLAHPLKFKDNGSPIVTDVMRKATGRITFLWPEQQREFLDLLTNNYTSLIAQMDALGENILEAKNLDLDARLIEAAEIAPARGEGIFLAPVKMEKVSVKAQGKALGPTELVDEILALSKTPAENVPPWVKTDPPATVLRRIAALFERRRQEQLAFVDQAYRTWLQAELGNMEKEGQKSADAKANAQRRYDAAFQRWRDTYSMLAPGMTIHLTGGSTDIDAVVLRVERNNRAARNPASLGLWDVTFALPDSNRLIVSTFSRLFPPGYSMSEDEVGLELSGSMTNPNDLMKQFEAAQKEGRDTRYIMTGNLLGGFEATKARGQIINYTGEDGVLRPGILMSKQFNAQDFVSNLAVRLPNGKTVVEFLKASSLGKVESTDDIVSISTAPNGRFLIDMPAARATGGVYFTEPSVRQAVNERFTRRGNRMVADVPEGELVRAVDAMIALDAVFETTSDQEAAKAAVAKHGGGVTRHANAGLGTPPPGASGLVAPEVRVRTSQEEARQIEGDIRSMGTRIIGRATSFQFRGQIEDIVQNSEVAAAIEAGGRQRNSTIGGFITTEGQMPGQALVVIATDDPAYDPRTTAGHEIWHYVEEFLLNGAERDMIAADLARGAASTIRRYVAAEAGVDVTSPIVAQMPAYELAAYAFQRYRRMREEGAPPFGLHVGIRRAFEKLYRFFQQVRRYLLRRGFENVNDLFEGVRLGEVRGRTPRGALPQTFAATNISPPAGQAQPPAPATPPPAPPVNFWQQRANRTLARVSRAGDAFRRSFQDQDIYIRRVQEEIEAAYGIKLGENIDAYLSATLYTGRASSRQNDLRFRWLEPLVQDMQTASVQREELDEYLYARHAEERNVVVGNMHDPKTDFHRAITDHSVVGASGMSTDEANAILARFHGDPRATHFRDFADRIDRLNRDTRIQLLRAGLISREVFDDWNSKYQHYVPLRGFEAEPEEDGPRVGRGRDVRGPEARRALGRRSTADSPLAYAVMQAQQAIIRAEKNRINKTVLRLVNQYPNPALWEVAKGRLVPYFDQSTGLVRQRWQHPSADWSNEDLFGVKVGGQQIFIDIHDPDIRRAMRGMTSGGIGAGNAIVQFMFRVARLFAAMRTQFDPEFVMTNYLRDLDSALINVGDIEGRGKGTRRKAIKDALLFTSVRKVFRALRDPTHNHQYARYFEEYRHAGGMVSFLNWDDVQGIKKQIDKELDRGNTFKFFRGIGRLVSDANASVENGVRLSVYIALRQNGVSQAAAARAAKELTVNFNRHGELGPLINMLYVFSNASIQGTFRMMKAVRRSKTVQAVFLGLFAYGMIMDLVNALLSDDDDDGENKYDKIPFWVKERNFIFMVPGSDSGLNFMKPAAYGYNLPMILGQQIMATIRGAVDPEVAAGNVITTALNTFNPLGSSGSLLQYITPSLLDPITQANEGPRGLTWYGGPLYPNKYDTRKPDSEEYSAKAPEWSIVMARELNSLFGGNVGRSSGEYTDIHPDVLNLWWNHIGGGVTRTIGNAWETIDALATGREVAPENIPFSRRVVGVTDSSAGLYSRFWDNWDRVDAANYEVDQLYKNGEDDKAAAAEVRNEKDLDVYSDLKPIYDRIMKIRKQKRKTESDRDLTAEERAAEVDEITAEEHELLLEADKLYGKKSY